MSIMITLRKALEYFFLFSGASSAYAVDFKPSLDGRFQQCVAETRFIVTIDELHQRGVAAWDAHTGHQNTNSVHEIVTGQIEKAPVNKRWITWSKASLAPGQSGYCINTTGVGILALDNTKPDEMPKRPFGVFYEKPLNDDFGNGNFFVDSFVAGHRQYGLNPAIILNNDNNSFSAIYSNASGTEVDIAQTDTKGSTRGNTDASGFHFANRNVLEDFGVH